MFLGRKTELASLERLYQTPDFQMVILYGRRRVGKTSLMAEFCRGKNHIFYVAIEQNDSAALSSFSEKVLETYPEAKSYLDVFPSWEMAFRYIAAQTGDRRMILVIDEYPYLASGSPSISSVLQRSIDTEMARTNLFLMLCGSSMSFMETQVLGYKSPLYGRRSAQLRVEPFDYLDSGCFFPDASDEDRLVAYSAAGGIPQYLGFIAKEASVREGIQRSFFDPTGPLYEEPSSILKQELREPSAYNSMIAAIAGGASRLNDIATKVGESSAKTGKYLKSLSDLRIVRRDLPYGEDSPRKGLYSLEDNMFRFWYRFVQGNVSNIQTGMGQEVFERKVLPHISEFMGRVFEDICTQYILRRNKAQTLPVWVDGAGRWWGADPVRRRQMDMDIVASSGNAAIFAECKWREERIGVEVLNDLIERSKVLARYDSRHYMLFSKLGFTPRLVNAVKARSDVELVGLQDLFA